MRPIVHVTGMNKTEMEYARELELRKKAGEIVDWKYEPFSLKLANKTYYKPDFLLVFPDHFEIHEVKGTFIREDAIVKLKVAAKMFPWFKFVLAQKKRKYWVIKEVVS